MVRQAHHERTLGNFEKALSVAFGGAGAENRCDKIFQRHGNPAEATQ